jgi:phage terminase small subunit
MTSPSLVEPDGTLTDRQLRFVFEYLIDQNASAAAARAGYSAASRASQGSELMKNEAVRERIRLELSSLLAEAQCSELQLIMERKRAAFFRAVKMFRSGWEVLPLDEMEEETRRALEVSTVMGKGGPVVKVRQPDRNKALRALERVHERLEKINQAHYARMEREGRCKSLEEIDAMDEAYAKAEAEKAEKSSGLYGSADRAGVPGVEIVEKDQGFSGFGQGAAPFDGLRANGSGGEDLEKPAVFLGAVAGAGLRADQISQRPMVLSGSSGVTAGQAAWRGGAPDVAARPVSALLMRNAPAPSGQLRVA